MQNGWLAPDLLTQNLHFKKVPGGFVCVRCTALKDTICQVLELAFLTWPTVSASPRPGSFHILPIPSTSHPLCYFTIFFPIASIHPLLKFLFPFYKMPASRSFLLLWSPSAYTLRSPVLLTQYTSCSSNSYPRGIQRETWVQSSLEWVVALFTVSVYQLTPNWIGIKNSLTHKKCNVAGKTVLVHL